MRLPVFIPLFLSLLGCGAPTYRKTVDHVEIPRFMGDWYVQAGRFTSFEKDVYDSIESYKWNEAKNRIDIDFRYRQGGHQGKLVKMPQKGWIENTRSNAEWTISPFWPLKFDYLVIGLDPDYRWTAIGVPSEDYLWIMSREKHMAKEEVAAVLAQLKDSGYDVSNIVYVPHAQ